MLERTRIAAAICIIAVVGVATFVGLRTLATTSGQSMRESGLIVPAQSEASPAQSEPRAPVSPAADVQEQPAPAPSDEAPDAPPAPAPEVAGPYHVEPSPPQRATPNDDDDDDEDDDEDDDDEDDD